MADTERNLLLQLREEAAELDRKVTVKHSHTAEFTHVDNATHTFLF